MTNRATATFILSIIGAAYQMISTSLAGLIDSNTSLLYYSYGYTLLFFTTIVVFWSASHMLEDWRGRITWPSIILALGITNLSLVLMAYYSQTSSPVLYRNTTPSLGAITALIAGPVILTIAGILGLLAVRQYSRQHGSTVIAHA